MKGRHRCFVNGVFLRYSVTYILKMLCVAALLAVGFAMARGQGAPNLEDCSLATAKRVGVTVRQGYPHQALREIEMSVCPSPGANRPSIVRQHNP